MSDRSGLLVTLRYRIELELWILIIGACVFLQASVEAAINSGNQSTIVDMLNLLLLKRFNTCNIIHVCTVLCLQ